MNVSGIYENKTSLMLNICAKSVAAGVLSKDALTWRYIEPMYPDMKTACLDENFPRQLNRATGNELELALRSASEKGKSVIIYIDYKWMFTHSPYFSAAIDLWFQSRNLAQVPITIIGVNATNSAD